jgi:hypothetical protein
MDFVPVRVSSMVILARTVIHNYVLKSMTVNLYIQTPIPALACYLSTNYLSLPLIPTSRLANRSLSPFTLCSLLLLPLIFYTHNDSKL